MKNTQTPLEKKLIAFIVKQIPTEKIKLTPKKKKVFEILKDTNFGCQAESVKSLMEVMVGKLPETRLSFPLGRAVVPIHNGNGMNYDIGEVAISIKKDKGFYGMFCKKYPTLGFGGNTGGNNMGTLIKDTRYATKKEIHNFILSLTEKQQTLLKNLLEIK